MKIAFIYHIESKQYLGVSVSSNDGAEFCNSVEVSLEKFSTPHAFTSREAAEKVLSDDAGWYNSSLNYPQRGIYNMDNCIVIEVDIPSEGVTACATKTDADYYSVSELALIREQLKEGKEAALAAVIARGYKLASIE